MIKNQFLFLIFCCFGKVIGQTTLTNDFFSKKDTIELVIKNKPIDNEIGFDDIFDNHTYLHKGSNKLSHSTVLTDNHWQHGTKFILTGNHKYNLEINPINKFWNFVSNDSKLEKELNFDINFRKDIFPIKNQMDFFKYSRFFEAKYLDNNNIREIDLNNYYEKKEKYLNEYTLKYGLSKEFLSNWTTLIKFERIRSNLSVAYQPEKWSNNYLNSILDQSLKELNNESLLNLREFRHSLQESTLILEYLKNGKVSNLLSKNYEVICENFSGKIKDYLIFNLLIEAKDKESKLIYSKEEFKLIFDTFLNENKSKEYEEYLIKSMKLENLNINNFDVINQNNEINSFEKIVKNQLTYIDFWASWCAPCRAEMPDSKKLKEEYSKKGVNFVYLSTDTNPAAWEKAMKQIGLSSSESYILPNGNNSPIGKKINLNSIPRYILVNKNGEIINKDAPRPSNPKIRILFDTLLKK